MPQKYTGRVLLILAVLALSLLFIFPPGSLFNPKLSFAQKVNLKPGIDIAGGTKLVYEIKAGEGSSGTNLAEQVMEALKKRVDPDGVRNLIWRPEGGDRLEIQMPLSAKSEEAQKARAQFSKAQEQLDRTNIRRVDVLNAVETLKGDARHARLAQLEMGSEARNKLFGGLTATYDQLKAAEAAKDAAKQAEVSLTYDNLKAQIDDTNLSSQSLQGILDDKADVRERGLADVKAKAKDFPDRLAAIDNYVNAWQAYAGLKGQLDDAGELKRLLKGSGVLEFHILVQGPDGSSPIAREMIDRLKAGGKGITPQQGDEMRWYVVDSPESMRGMPVHDYNGKQYMLAWTTPERSMTNRTGQPRWALERAYPAQTDYGIRAVGFRFDANGAAAFGELTANNLKQMMVVMLDNKIISAATIQSVISREGIISREAGYPEQEFKYLISTLSAGSLPAQLAEEPISEQTVEPQLGAENLRNGLLSAVFGLVVVGVFLISYYHFAGLVAFCAVLMNVVLILASVAAIDGTFTLPGIAGIILTVGAAVDANVLIFERLREEQHRGMGLKLALKNAYQQAFSAILDSNVTTIITSIVLYWLGTEEVKGFGLTLLIGLIWSLFTSLFVTRTVFGVLIDHFGLTHLGSLPLSHPKLDKALKPNVNWIGLAWIFVTFSVVAIVVGLACFVKKVNSREILDIEFAGGTQVQVDLTKDMTTREVEDLLKKKEAVLPSMSVLSLGKTKRSFEVVTLNTDSIGVQNALLAPDTLGPVLKLQVASSYDHVKDTADQAISAGAILPIEDTSLSIKLDAGGNFTPATTASHVGGAAIILQNLQPPLAPSEIKERLTRQRLQPQTDPLLSQYRAVDVESATGGNEPTTTAVVMVSDDTISTRDAERWRGELASPMWKLINDAVNRPPQLSKVSSFGPSIAANTTTAAFAALILSSVVIMVYVWFRFGDLVYGTATIVAMIHDVVMVVGFIGISHYVADTAIGKALMIDAFRLNLTVVAAILTVMSYSMLDTIVVFDRIRENKGKYGAVNKDEINLSVNQTMSRTILTGSTNIVTVLAMYILGGTAIHGFTFALLVGIIIGTYSSIAVAAPILLIGSKKAGK